MLLLRTSAFCALLAVTAVAGAQDRPEALFNLVSLSAQASREVSNDTLLAVMAAEAEGPDAPALADTVNRAMRDALKVAKGYGAVKSSTGTYQTLPVYDKAKVVRWRVRQELRLESRDFAAASELVGKLQPALVVVRMNTFVSAEARRAAEQSLVAEAIAAFHERAGVAREANRAKGWRLKDMNIGTADHAGVPVRALAAPAMLRSDSAPPVVEAGTSTIQVTVNGTVQLQ